MEELRFAVIDMFDCISFESDNVLDCVDFVENVDGILELRGIYDYKQNMYLDEADILDITGCQLHSFDNELENKNEGDKKMKIYITKKHSKKKNKDYVVLATRKNGKEIFLTFDHLPICRLAEMNFDDLNELLDKGDIEL